MKLSEALKNYIFTTKIEIEGSGDFVVLREPTQAEIVQLKKEKDDEVGMVDSMENLFVSCLVDHSFTRDDEKKASNNEVYEVLKKSSTLFSEILTAWMDSLPFQSRLKKETKSAN